MKSIIKVLMCTSFALVTTGVMAQTTPAAGGAMTKDPMMKPMTMQQCKDHMGMAKTDAMKKDPAMMKMEKECADMMKKDGGMMKDGNMMKKDSMPMEPAKK